MSIRSAIGTYIAGRQPITAIVADRLGPVKLTQDTSYPNLVWRRASGGRDVYLDGAAATAAPVFIFSGRALTYAAVDELMEAVRGELDGWNSRLDNATRPTTFTSALVDEMDDYENPIAGDDAGGGCYRIDHHYRITHRESVPNYV